MNKKITKLASLALDFGKVDRITSHQDGIHPESDTDHTVMLGILGTALASKLYKDLDLGLVAQFALVHDLVEVHAGDTPTLKGISPDHSKQKKKREKIALNKIKKEFGSHFSWVHETIEKYEKLDTKEARFIKVLDKILPQITTVLNKAKAVNEKKLANREDVKKGQDGIKEQMKKITDDMPEMMEIWEYFNSRQLKFINK